MASLLTIIYRFKHIVYKIDKVHIDESGKICCSAQEMNKYILTSLPLLWMTPFSTLT